MSRLEGIREGLYEKKVEKPIADASWPLPLPEKSKPEVKFSWNSPVGSEVDTLMAHSRFSKTKQRRSAIKFLIIAAVLAVAGATLYVGYTMLFNQGQTDFSIIGPDQITAGEPVIFILRVINKSSVAFKTGVVELTLPEGSFYADGGNTSTASPRRKFEIGDLPPNGEFSRELQVRILGARGESRIINGKLAYRPENIESELTKETEFKVNIVRVPIAVTVDAPERVSSGQEVSFVIGVDSELSAPLGDMALGIEFPSGFKILASSPPFDIESENVWRLGDLVSGTSRTISIRGTITGEPEEVKTLHIRLGRYASSSKAWLLLTEVTAGPTIASPFLFAQTSLGGARRGALTPGSRVDGNVIFKNNLNQKAQNVDIAISFPEKFVELESIQAEKGFYDVTKKALSWNPSSDSRLKELGPGEEGTLIFSFVIKSNVPIRGFGDKNFIFPVTTIINTGVPPPEYRGVALEYRDHAEFKIESRLFLSARAGYYDSPATNSGPLPPKVRRVTTYTIYFKLSSGANDLKDVEVRAELPGGVEWQKTIASDLGTVSFNPASKEIFWRIPKLNAATGILRPPASAIIQLAFTPADNQVNTSPPILKSIAASGIDVFTDSTESDTENDLTTELRADSQSKFEEWRVIK